MVISSDNFRNQKTYSTSEYLRDSFWLIDISYRYYLSLKRKLSKTGNHILDAEIETYLFRFIENLPYFILILYLGVLSVLTLIKVTEKQNGVRLSAIITKSMEPEIKPGSMIISVPKMSYKKGDIITFYEQNINNEENTGRVLTHRIVEINSSGQENTYIKTKGDANNFADPGHISRKQIIGKVILIYPNIGYLEILIKTIPGFIVFVVLPVIILLKNEIRYLRSEKLNLGSLKFGH